MFDVGVVAEKKDYGKFRAAISYLNDLVDSDEEALTLVTLLMVNSARNLGDKDPNGTITLTGLTSRGIPMGDVIITIGQQVELVEEEVPTLREEKSAKKVKPGTLPKPLAKTSVPPTKKKRQPKQAKEWTGKPGKLKQVAENKYVDENGVTFDGNGYAIGADGKPTQNPYRKIPENLSPNPQPVIPTGSFGTHGSFSGGDI